MAGMSFLSAMLALAMMQNNVSNHSLGSTLYHSCLVAQQHVSGKAPADHDLLDESRCDEYMDGFLAGKRGGICMGDYTVKTFITKYLIYMQKHQKLMNVDRAEGVQATFSDSFSCAL